MANPNMTMAVTFSKGGVTIDYSGSESEPFSARISDPYDAQAFNGALFALGLLVKELSDDEALGTGNSGEKDS